MSDVMTPEQRSRCMSRIRGRDTSPEKTLRQALHAKGYRYRTHHRLPGRPDIVFVSAKLAVFVDGCFWHRCPLHSTSPKQHASFWRQKIDGNVARDKRVRRKLRLAGWSVMRIWEHQVDANPVRLVERISKRLAARQFITTKMPSSKPRLRPKERRTRLSPVTLPSSKRYDHVGSRHGGPQHHVSEEQPTRKNRPLDGDYRF